MKALKHVRNGCAWKRKGLVIAIVMCIAVAGFVLEASATPYYYTDFNSGVPTEFGGIITTESVRGYAGYGTGADVFSGDFLRNKTGRQDDPPTSIAATTLTMMGLPTHTSIDLGFLLAIINSWDGNGARDPNNAPDYFNVTVDGLTIFSNTFENMQIRAQGYVPPPGVQLINRELPSEHFPLLFTPHEYYEPVLSAAYNMGLDPIFDNIAHTASTLTVAWYASGAGYQGGLDESWAIDNVSITLNGTTPIPEPATMLLLGSGLAGLAGLRRKFRKK